MLGGDTTSFYVHTKFNFVERGEIYKEQKPFFFLRFRTFASVKLYRDTEYCKFASIEVKN